MKQIKNSCCYISTKDDKYICDISLSEEQFIDICNAHKVLVKYKQIQEKINLLEDAIDEFVGSRNYFERLYIIRSITEIVSLFYMYIENITCATTRDFGKESTELSSLKSAMSSEFDHNFAYRFIYKLRSNITHNMFPSHRTNINKDKEIHIYIYFDKDTITQKAWGKAVAEDLRTCSEIDIISLLQDLKTSIVNIASTCVNFYGISTLVDACDRLLLHEKVSEFELIRQAIGRVSYDGDNINLSNIIDFNFEELKQIRSNLTISTQ